MSALLLPSLAEQKFSQELAYAEKVIFSSPESIWLSKSRELSEFVLGLKNPESKIFKILNAEAIVKVISTYEEQIRTGTLDRETCHLVFSLAGLEIWLETFFES